MIHVIPSLDLYEIDAVETILTPALLIYPEIVDENITATLRMLDNNPARWRPHIKTAKIPAVMRQLVGRGVDHFKCSTTLELLTGCQSGAQDVLLAYSVMGTNARRVREIAEHFSEVRISVLIESSGQAATWRGTPIGVFIDVNPGMNRTGIAQERTAEIVELAASLGQQFRGLHYYDGHMSSAPAAEREGRAHSGYDQLMRIVKELEAARVPPGEVITSGTPALPFAVSYAGFRNAAFVHRVSPGTVLYNDMVSLEQLPGYGYKPAALVLATVVSHPTPRILTCDAGHKSVSADAGVPTCSVLGFPDLRPGKPSEEHLPIENVSGTTPPALGAKLYLLPRHVCPSVNNFDHALMVVDGQIRSIESVSARGHECPVPSVIAFRDASGAVALAG